MCVNVKTPLDTLPLKPPPEESELTVVFDDLLVAVLVCVNVTETVPAGEAGEGHPGRSV